MKSYITVSKEHRIEYIVEKSRFIATAIPCTTEAEAQAAITRITKEFWDATHNCTAYTLGPNQEQQRSSDNGEPSGTAGKPMLEVLKKTGITNTLIVVTRYFGGIKLGAGGLIRAYAHSAAEVIHKAPKTLHAPRQCVSITIDYSLYGSVERYLQDKKYYYETNFTDTVSITIYVDPQHLSELETIITNLTSGQHNWTLLESTVVALPYTDTTN